MGKLKTFCLFFLFVVALLVAGALQAQSNPYVICKTKPSSLTKFLNTPDKIRSKCSKGVREAI